MLMFINWSHNLSTLCQSVGLINWFPKALFPLLLSINLVYTLFNVLIEINIIQLQQKCLSVNSGHAN